MVTHSVFLPGESHEHRNLVGYSPWGRKSIGHKLATRQQQQYLVAYYFIGILEKLKIYVPIPNFSMCCS